MKKMVLGKTSKQAPANRTIYDIQIIYTKFVKGANPTTTSDLQKALTWYKNGNDVSIIEDYNGFKMLRNKGIRYTDAGELTSMIPTKYQKVYKTINKKSNPLTPEDLEHIEKVDGSERLVCTF